MKIRLEIELGNDAMQTPKDVIRALEGVIIDLTKNGLVGLGEQCKIRDANGNTVGKWEVTA